MFLRAGGMNPRGFARAAPAPAIAATEAVASPLIFSIIAVALAGFGGRREITATQPRMAPAATRSTIATQVFGDDGVFEAAASPRTKAATTPIRSVAESAPR